MPLLGGGQTASLRRFSTIFVRVRECAGVTQRGGIEQRAGADSAEQVGLSGFERDEAAKNVQQVEKIGRVFGQPAIRLDAVERRWRALVADDGAQQNPDVFSGRQESFHRQGVPSQQAIPRPRPGLEQASQEAREADLPVHRQ